jgi:hypothetical protein
MMLEIVSRALCGGPLGGHVGDLAATGNAFPLTLAVDVGNGGGWNDGTYVLARLGDAVACARTRLATVAGRQRSVSPPTQARAAPISRSASVWSGRAGASVDR